jgi:hypothetical protein
MIEQPGVAVGYGAVARQAMQSSPSLETEAAEYAALFERLRSTA